MKKFVILPLVLLSLSGCSGILEKQEPICTGVALIGGQETTVQIYGVRKVLRQTEYRAGDPFNWRWVNSNNFSKTTCPKA